MSVSKTAMHSRLHAGTEVRFRLRLRNTGKVTARRVRVCDRLPAGLGYTSARGARVQGRTACFSAGTMRAKQTRTFTIVTRALSTSRSRRICNTAVRTARGNRARTVRECVRVLPAVAQQGGVTG